MLVGSVGSGRWTNREAGRDAARRTPAPRSASRSSTTAAPPAARADAPRGAALESAPGRAVAALTIPWRGGWALGSLPVAGS